MTLAPHYLYFSPFLSWLALASLFTRSLSLIPDILTTFLHSGPLHWLFPWSGTFFLKISAELTTTSLTSLQVLASISLSYKTQLDHILQITVRHCHSHPISPRNPCCTSVLSYFAPLVSILYS